MPEWNADWTDWTDRHGSEDEFGARKSEWGVQ